MSTSVNSSTSSLSALSAKTGMAGLVSGLDTDSLVASLTSANRAKIAQSQQRVQTMQWKQASYRNVSKTLKEFQSKYLDVLSTTNFRSASMYNTVKSSSASTKISVSSTNAATAGNITINKITQLATNQTVTGKTGASTTLSGSDVANTAGLLSGISPGVSKSFLLKMDGQVRTITLDEAFKTDVGNIGINGFEEALQTKIDEAFGKKSTGESLIKVSIPDGGVLGLSASGSQLTVSALNGDNATLDYLKLTDGQTDRLTTTTTLGALPLANGLDDLDEYKVTINSVDFTFKKTDSLTSVMSRINSSAAGVTMNYSSITDKFTLTAKASGMGDNIKVNDATGNLMESLGLNGTENTNMVTTAGKNAELTINNQSIVRTSNSIEVDGVKIELLEKSDEAITISSKADSTSLKDTIKSFVTDYNNMIEMMNKLVKENFDSDYPPLTDEQRADMSEKEIETWETKAKVGLLRGDSLLKGIASKMQSMIYGSAVSGGISLFDLGITSAGYSENGKLKIDEAKLTTAIETKGSAIQELFTTEKTGIAQQLNEIINTATKTSGAKGTRGSLIEMAGYESTLSDTENSITDNVTKANKSIANLKIKLKTEETYYWGKFSALESALQQLNNQSAILAQFSSGA